MIHRTKWHPKRLTSLAIVAALYIVLTFAFSAFSYGNIQFRFAEILTLLAFFNPFYIVSLTLGCFIANLLSPIGTLDLIFGTLATFLSVSVIALLGHRLRQYKLTLWLASLVPVVFNSVIIGTLLYFISGLPFALSVLILQVGLGEFVVVTLIGVPLTLYLLKHYPKFLFFLQQI
jgi:uncharacterized membrane protein